MKMINRKGEVFGLLTVLSRHGTNSSKHTTWRCLCECGNTTICTANNLRAGHSKSCGCLIKGKPAKNRLNITGEIYGELTVIESISKHGKTKLRCQCSCGTTTLVSIGHLRNGHTTSCGCKRGEKHGMSNTSLYTCYRTQMERCHNPNNRNHKNYGGRGITMHKPWRDSFIEYEKYVTRELGEKPKDYTMDRIDNNGNYEPGNIQWATMKQQCNNKRNTTMIEFNGITKPISEWAEQFNINYSTLRSRLRSNWNIEQALTRKVCKPSRLVML